MADSGKTSAEYRRLPGKWMGAQRLYLGVDHLLVVETRYLVQEVRRFYFRDIHAIVISAKSGRGAANVLLTIAVIVMGLLGVAQSAAGDGAWAAFFWVMTGLFGLALFLVAAASSDCSCRIRTIVSERKLTAAGRLRHAENLVRVLTPLIEAAQENRPAPGPVAEAAETGAAAPAAAPAPPGTLPPSASAPLPLSRYKGGAHLATFIGLLLAAGLAAATALGGALADIGRYATLPLYVVLMGLVVAALVKQRGSGLPGGVRKVVWWTLGYMGVFYFGWVMLPAFAASVEGMPEMTRFLLPPMDVGGVWAVLVFCPLTLGLLGLGLMLARRGAKAKAASVG